MSYTVSRRSSELGIRLALGSTRSKVLWVVLRESLIVIGAGIFVGACLSLAGTRLVSHLLYGLGPRDPLTLAALPSCCCWSRLHRACCQRGEPECESNGGFASRVIE